MDYVRHHYIPQFILRNYSKEIDSDGDELINVYNNFSNEVNKLKTNNAYMVENLYDSNQFADMKQLEKDFGKYLENKVAPIIKRILDSDKEFVMNRDELNLIKKYLLITIYRTETNMSYYLKDNVNGKMEFSDLSIRDGESKLDFWKREMYTILHKEWDYLCSTECEIESVQHFTRDIYQSHLCIFESDTEEFIVSDLGKVSEMVPIDISGVKLEDIEKAAKLFSKSHSSNVKKIIEYELKNKRSKIETFMFFPISPKRAIVVAKKINISGFETRYYEMSVTLNKKRFAPPLNQYINIQIYSLYNQIQEYSHQNNGSQYYYEVENTLKQIKSLYEKDDKFIYPIQMLNENEVISINCMMLNESIKCISFMNPLKICKSIRAYNDMYRANTPNIKNNFLGSESVIKKV